MKSWLKKIFKGEPIKNIVFAALCFILGFPGLLLTFIGMFVAHSKVRDFGIVCVATFCGSLAVWCIFNKDKKGTIACIVLALLCLYILLLY